MAATWLRTGCLQATRLLTDLRMLAAGGGWCQSGPLVSFFSHRRFFQSQRYSFTLADRIFWQKIKNEVDPLRPFRLGKQCLEVVEFIFGSANVHTLLPAERSAASRGGPPAMSGRRVDLADQFHQAGISIVGIQETRCRGQVIGLCRGFGVFAPVADQASHGGVELWIRQDIMEDPRSFHVLVAEPRFLLVKDHAATGVIQFCVCHGPNSTRNKLKFRRDGVVPPHSSGALVRILYHSRCFAMPMRGLDRSRRCRLAIRRRIGRIRLARNFMPCSWNGTFVCQQRCQARTIILPSLPERGAPGHRSLQIFGYVCPNTNGKNHCPAWKTQSLLVSEICTVIFWADCFGRDNLRKFFYNTVGKKFQIGNAFL